MDATHSFLKPEDRQSIEREVSQFLSTSKMTLATDRETDMPLALMLIQDGHLEALFVAAGQRGRGIGKMLIEHALMRGTAHTTDVNEQNTDAMGFYKNLGYSVIGRSDVDSSGRPYPLLHLRMNP